MKKICYRAFVSYAVILPMLLILSSCSNDDYLNAIPENSTALLAVDVQNLSDKDMSERIADLLETKDIGDCGLNLSSKIYIFETIEGNIGFSAKVADDGELEKCMGRLEKKGYCQNVSEYKDFKFSVIKDAWVAGFSPNALIVMGPALPAQQSELKQQIAKYLGNSEEQGIKNSPLFARLDSMNSPVALVAKASALPEKLAVPFTLCAPKDADASQIMIAAELDTSDKTCLTIRGESFSFDKDIDNELRASNSIFRPIKGAYVGNVPGNSFAGIFMNVDGSQFIKLLHSNKTFQALLAGMNMAVDMDNIIKSFDGDVAMFIPSEKGEKGWGMAAKLKSKRFLDDVGYWKQSCPAGSKITDWDNDAYCFTDGERAFYFGVSSDMQFYSGHSADCAREILSKSATPLPSGVQEKIKGERLAVFFNVRDLLGDNTFANELLGNADTVLYFMK